MLNTQTANKLTDNSTPIDPRLQVLVSQTAAMLNTDTVDTDAMLSELGIDSLNVVELILICEQIYSGLSDPEALRFDNFTTLSDIHDQLVAISANHAVEH